MKHKSSYVSDNRACFGWILAPGAGLHLSGSPASEAHGPSSSTAHAPLTQGLHCHGADELKLPG